MDKKCYDCKFAGDVPGSCHYSCHHPSLDDVGTKAIALMYLITPKILNIKATPHGIRSGWFNFPLDFDPVWLENCDGYESKQVETAKGGDSID